jgi:glycosyltransferase involved in cell wall biosynthesis
LPKPVVFVLKGYPRLSETFIAQEIRALEARGLDIRIVSLRHPTDGAIHPVHREIRAPVLYLPEYLHNDPGRVVRAWRLARRLPGYRKAFRLWLGDYWRDRSVNRIRRFGQACVLAAEWPDGAGALHAHFLHTPASVARYAAHMLGIPWSCSAHARDIWTTPDWEKRAKLADLAWCVTCTKMGADHLRGLADDPARVHLVYHGLDLVRFSTPTVSKPARNGGRIGQPVRILAVGRLVEKKGFDVLIAALARLDKTLHWKLTHIGGGALGIRLKAQAIRAGIERRIEWRGPATQDEVLTALRDTDLFVLPSRIATDGDRDGLPNVLMEAASQNLAIISTTQPAIRELIEPEMTGLLVRPDDATALATAIDRLARDPAERSRLGFAAAWRVKRDFDMADGVKQLAGLFGLDTPPETETAAADTISADPDPATAP